MARLSMKMNDKVNIKTKSNVKDQNEKFEK